jgi:hypothetical protein
MNNSALEWMFVICIIVLFTTTYGAARQRDELKAEAVKRGFAEWVVNDKGNTTFKWKDGTK